MWSFDIRPFEGAFPIRFGMSRAEVLTVLGGKPIAGKANDSFGKSLEINIGYDEVGAVDHIGMSPGAFELKFNGTPLWTPSDHPDPNGLLLVHDPDPMEHVGFLSFLKIGVKTTGYHDDDPDDLALVVWPTGAWDKFLAKAKRPDLSKYKR